MAKTSKKAEVTVGSVWKLPRYIGIVRQVDLGRPGGPSAQVQWLPWKSNVMPNLNWWPIDQLQDRPFGNKKEPHGNR